MMGYTRPLAQHPLREAEHKGLLSCALLHKTEDCAPAPTQTARKSHRVNRRWHREDMLTPKYLSAWPTIMGGIIVRIYDYWHNLTKGWHCFQCQINFKNLFPNVNGVASQETGNLDALAALSLILASRLKFQGILAWKSAEKCHSMLFNGNDHAKQLRKQSRGKGVQGECRLCHRDMNVGAHAPRPQALDLTHHWASSQPACQISLELHNI